MDVKDNLTNAPSYTTNVSVCATKQIISSGGGTYQNRVIGTYQAIDSIRTGSFQPGKFRINPVTIIRKTGSVSIATIEFGCGTSFYRDHYSGPLAVLQAGITDDGFDNNMLAWSLDKANSKTRGAAFELGMFVGELKETLELLRHPFRSLGRFLAAMFNPKSRGHGARSFSALANLFLEYEYGLRPLIEDVCTAIALVEKGFAKLDRRIHRKRGKATRKYTVESSGQFYVTGGNSGCYVPYTKTSKYSITSTSIVYYQFTVAQVRLAHLMGMEWYDIPRIAWELTKLSFVWDWFLRVSDWLNAISPNPTIRSLGNCTSQKMSVEQTIRTGQPTCAGGVSFYTPSIFTGHMEILRRVVGSATPYLPAFTPDMSSIRHILDALALTWQQLGHNLRRH